MQNSQVDCPGAKAFFSWLSLGPDAFYLITAALVDNPFN